jgi:hypothetical protein
MNMTVNIVYIQSIAEMKLFLTAKYFYESTMNRYQKLHVHDFRNVLTSILLLTETSTRKLLWGKGRPAHNADNLSAICEPIV